MRVPEEPRSIAGSASMHARCCAAAISCWLLLGGDRARLVELTGVSGRGDASGGAVGVGGVTSLPSALLARDVGSGAQQAGEDATSSALSVGIGSRNDEGKPALRHVCRARKVSVRGETGAARRSEAGTDWRVAPASVR